MELWKKRIELQRLASLKPKIRTVLAWLRKKSLARIRGRRFPGD
jgi:hypothetical protein